MLQCWVNKYLKLLNFLDCPLYHYIIIFFVSFYHFQFKVYLFWHNLPAGGSDGKVSAYNVGDLGSIPELGRSPGEGNGNVSSILAWKIAWTEEPGRLHSPHAWATSLSLFWQKYSNCFWRGWFLFAWNIFLYPFTLNLSVSLSLKWISYRQHMVGSCFFFFNPFKSSMYL